MRIDSRTGQSHPVSMWAWPVAHAVMAEETAGRDRTFFSASRAMPALAGFCSVPGFPGVCAVSPDVSRMESTGIFWFSVCKTEVLASVTSS